MVLSQLSALPTQHPDTLVSINNLAISLGQQGKSAEAELVHWQTELRSEQNMPAAEYPDNRLHAGTPKKRKVEHEDNRDLRRSLRIKGRPTP
jgi:hypothetical protein